MSTIPRYDGNSRAEQTKKWKRRMAKRQAKRLAKLARQKKKLTSASRVS